MEGRTAMKYTESTKAHYDVLYRYFSLHVFIITFITVIISKYYPIYYC